MTFEGFVQPTKNYFPVPNNWIDICANIRDISELKVIQYVIRHTWGFREFGICKTISVDEFMHGRRRQDQTRMDSGTGLSEQSVRNGLNKAIKDGYLIYEIDTSDAGRIKKSYALRMQSSPEQVQTLDPPQTLDPLATIPPGTNFIPQGTKLYTSDSQSLDPRVLNFIPRTEKETLERNLGNTLKEREIPASASTITDLAEFRNECALSSSSSNTQRLSEKDLAECEAETEHRIKAVKPLVEQKPATPAPLPLAADQSVDCQGDAGGEQAHRSVGSRVMTLTVPAGASTGTLSPPRTSTGARQGRNGLKITHAPTSTPPTQGTFSLKETGDLPRSEKELRKMEQRIDGMRAEQIWQVVEDEMHTTFEPSHRRWIANTRGMTLLLEMKITNEKLRLALQAMDNYQILHFNLELFHGWIPGLLAPKKAPSSSKNQEPETGGRKNFTGYAKELQARIAAGGC
jgi:hypothetical protein